MIATITDIKPYANNSNERLVFLRVEGRETAFIISKDEVGKFDQDQQVELTAKDFFYWILTQGEQTTTIEYYSAPDQKPKLL